MNEHELDFDHLRWVAETAAHRYSDRSHETFYKTFSPFVVLKLLDLCEKVGNVDENDQK